MWCVPRRTDSYSSTGTSWRELRLPDTSIPQRRTADTCQFHNSATPQRPINTQRPTPKTSKTPNAQRPKRPNQEFELRFLAWEFWTLGVGRYLGVAEL